MNHVISRRLPHSRRFTRVAAVLLALLVSACAAQYQQPGPARQPSSLGETSWQTPDGVGLPLRAWLPDGSPKAVVLALHGMNDYSNFFDEPGKYLAGKGIAAYAYDQRGFGAAPRPGIWSSADAMAQDARSMAELLAARHPGTSLYLLGESMGGAVTMLAVSNQPPGPIRGVILSAPAVWSRTSMGFFQRTALWLAYQVAPGWKLTGEGLNIMPSDNIPMLRKLSADPLVIKGTRVDAIHGVVDLMDAAARSGPGITLPTLVLYGEKDEVIPAAPTWAMAATLGNKSATLGDTIGPRDKAGPRMAFYANGYHMLLRDLQAQVVLDDIAAWMADPTAPLPSGADIYARDAHPSRRE